MADIRPQMLEKVIENWTSRLDYIRASRGSPMPEIIFKIPNQERDEPPSHTRPRPWISVSADLTSFWALGAEDLQAPLAQEDRNLLPENVVKSSLSGCPPQASNG
ncbi:hypothetical protein TNCV_1568051 [Trichonephila clavipes]|nr:hypothetical protein TNCV_1568051 [Trichonephila clavipes]